MGGDTVLDSKQKIAAGGTLAALGGVGILLATLLGSSLLSSPLWTVSLFVVGAASGVGAVLALFGLYEHVHGV